jgi:hypothetical protein
MRVLFSGGVRALSAKDTNGQIGTFHAGILPEMRDAALARVAIADDCVCWD